MDSFLGLEIRVDLKAFVSFEQSSDSAEFYYRYKDTLYKFYSHFVINLYLICSE